jgi:hypothetical protein
MKTLLPVLAALVIVPAASAAYPTPFAAQGIGASVYSLDHSRMFVALKGANGTQVQVVGANGGAVLRSRSLAGNWGIPMLTYNDVTGGLFHDGSAFVLQSVGIAETTKFTILSTRDLTVRDTITLDGYFGFDALSPDGSTLYLIQHTSTQDYQHYVVRAYDLRTHTLTAGRIADKAQKSWVMKGQAVARVTSPTGRWVYTLYTNPGGYPFIHALDTVNGVAHCVGLPWEAANQNPVYQFTLSLNGSWLSVNRPGVSGGVWKRIQTGPWRIS